MPETFASCIYITDITIDYKIMLYSYHMIELWFHSTEYHEW